MCRQLSLDETNLARLQGENLRLSAKLIYAFRWLETSFNEEADIKNQQAPTIQGQTISGESSKKSTTGHAE